MTYAVALHCLFHVFNPFKMAVQFFWTASSFPNIDGRNAFSSSSIGPWPVRKIPEMA